MILGTDSHKRDEARKAGRFVAFWHIVDDRRIELHDSLWCGPEYIDQYWCPVLNIIHTNDLDHVSCFTKNGYLKIQQNLTHRRMAHARAKANGLCIRTDPANDK